MSEIDNDWQPWFAWYPVEVDAYQLSDISNGRLHYTVVGRWVERMWAPAISQNDELEQDPIPARWKYRLPQ